jgi:hypothetical protein
MKKLFLTALVFAGISATSFAQITLTATALNPVVGDTFTVINCDTIGRNLTTELANTGANHTWNYSTLSAISTDNVHAIACSATPYCSLVLASTTIAEKTLSSSAYAYSINNSDSSSITGIYYSASQNVIYTDPMKVLKYPFHYLDTFTDAYSGSLTYNPGTGAITAHETGSIHVVCDGWGTLTTPTPGIVDTVLRVVGTQSYIDSAMIFTASVVITVQITTIQWYKLNYHSPLLSMSFVNQTSGPGSLNTKTISYDKRYKPSGVTNIPMLENSLSIYPNPTASNLNIRFEANDKVRISLVDMVGREIAVIANETATGMKEITYSTSSLAKGVYMVHVQSGAEIITRKVVIE